MAMLPVHAQDRFPRRSAWRVLQIIWLSGLCSLGSCVARPPFVVLTIEDPESVATGFARLEVGTSRQRLRVVHVARSTLPVSVTITAEEPGQKELWAEALTAGGRALGRGSAKARFARQGTSTAVVRLGKACVDAGECVDGSFCNGEEQCMAGVCIKGSARCAANVGCATSTCAELGGGTGTCYTTVDHAQCGEGHYCNPLHGCLAGKGCTEDADCLDPSICNGEERCANMVCTSGGPPSLDDGDICTLDGCDDRRIEEGENAIFHYALESLDGSACTRAAGGVGICVSAKNGCVESECGDGLVFGGAGEDCEDGNGNANDGCDDCRHTRWQSMVLVGLGEGHGQAKAVALSSPRRVAVDRRGNLFVADTHNHRVRRVDGQSGIITTVAGTGAWGYSGDAGAATGAQLFWPAGVSVDGADNIFIADSGNQRIRRVDGQSGIIATVAGTGTGGFSGDGGPAASAELAGPAGLCVDGAGNLFVSDWGNHRIRRVDEQSGIITTVAGTGTQGYSGDGLAATSSELDAPEGISVDGSGNLFIADYGNNTVRRVDGESGIITTVAGTGIFGFSVDGGVATTSDLAGPSDAAADSSGNVFIADRHTARIRRVDAASGIITTVAGTGTSGFSGDGSVSTSAQLTAPEGVSLDRTGNLFIADTWNHRIRRVDGQSGIIETVAGTGYRGSIGDGGVATSASLGHPCHVMGDGSGNLFIAAQYGNHIRRVDGATGIITTVAGTGLRGYTGDGGAATNAQLDRPCGVAVDDSGNVFIGDTFNHRIRRVDGQSGIITTVAGNGTNGSAGDGDAATNAQLGYPYGVAVNDSGSLFVASSNRIRRVDGQSGIITTVAGTGTGGYAGDEGMATSAELYNPQDVSVDHAGNLFIADAWNHRIRRVDGQSGIITTVAGTGEPGFSGDGEAATSAKLLYPNGVALDGSGNILVADKDNLRVRRVDHESGIIRTVAGNGTYGFAGDGGLATTARLTKPNAVSVDGADNVLVADTDNSCVRRIDATTGAITTVAGPMDPAGDGPVLTSVLGQPRALASIGGGADLWLVADGVSGRIRSVDLVTDQVASRVGYPSGFVEDGAEARYGRLLLGAAGIAADSAAGFVYVTEQQGHTVRRVDVSASPWRVASFAGDQGVAGHADGNLGEARFSGPAGLAFDGVRNLVYIADSGNHVVRTIDVDEGTVSTYAGKPQYRGYFGEDVLARDALLYSPGALALGQDGSLYIADTQNHRVRRVDPLGVIATVVGDGTGASFGEGGPARLYPVDTPQGLTVDVWGNLFVTSRLSVRVVTAGADGVATGEDEVMTIYGSAPRQEYPTSVTFCLTGIAVLPSELGDEDARLFVLDACQGFVLQLTRDWL